MNIKIGRNDPCPCGSGRKYKQCCGKPGNQPVEDYQMQAVSRALEWLQKMHRKPFAHEIEQLTFHQFWPEDEPNPEGVPDDLWQMIQINVLEWLLARGELLIKDEYIPVQDLLFGPGGPRLSTAQQDYLLQLTQKFLRLYYITDSRPGDGFTLINALDEDAEPLQVVEKSGSQSLDAGEYLAARVLFVDDHLEFSGAMYPFSTLYIGQILDAAPQFLQAFRKQFPRENTDHALERWLVGQWFQQVISAPAMPQMIDASTGEPMLLVTDHYQIVDHQALLDKLAACDELEKTGEYSWAYLEEHGDGQIRARLTVNLPEPDDRHQDRFSLFCRTLKLADEGRPRFERMVGNSVRYLTRELTDPTGAMATSDLQSGQHDFEPPDIDPDDMTAIISEFMHKHYANWADEPIPALQNKTPREAIASTSGKERVKGLLRSYENGEKDMAASQGREPVSYQFLWDELGLSRD